MAARSPNAPDQRADEDALHDHVERADQRQQRADLPGAPAVAISGVEDEDGGEDVVGEVEQEVDDREAAEFGMRAQQQPWRRTGWRVSRKTPCAFAASSDSGRISQP